MALRKAFTIEGVSIDAASPEAARAVLETRRAAQLAKDEAVRVIAGDVYKTRAEADAACAAHDKALGLPKPGTARWTEPIELADGWLVQRPDRGGEAIDRARVVVVDEDVKPTKGKR